MEAAPRSPRLSRSLRQLRTLIPPFAAYQAVRLQVELLFGREMTSAPRAQSASDRPAALRRSKTWPSNQHESILQRSSKSMRMVLTRKEVGCYLCSFWDEETV